MGSLDNMVTQREKYIAYRIGEMESDRDHELAVRVVMDILESDDRQEFCDLMLRSFREGGACWDASADQQRMVERYARVRLLAEWGRVESGDFTMGDGEAERLRREEFVEAEEWRMARDEL